MFDECHKAKNLVPSGAGRPSKTGLTVLEMQRRLPKARVVYCSATGEKSIGVYYRLCRLDDMFKHLNLYIISVYWFGNDVDI